MRRVVRLAASMAFMLASAGFGAGQETTGTIRGRFVDAQGLAIPGAPVAVAGGQGVRSVLSDSDGRFVIPFLAPGDYSLRAQLPGFKLVDLNALRVELGQATDVRVTMEIAGVAEAVSVNAAASVTASPSLAAGVVIAGETLQQVPVGRRVSDGLYLAQGVSSGGSVGRANPSISGGSGLDNHYVIDGVNVTNAGYGAFGSYSPVFGSLGNATPPDFIKQVQVKSSGYDAEFGQSMGGVVNITTLSGTNTVRGSLFAYAQPAGLESSWRQYESATGTVQVLANQTSDAGAEAGGPVVRNRVFFFAATDLQREQTAVEAPKGFPLYGLGPFEQERRGVPYLAKISIRIADGHFVEASSLGDPSNGGMGPQRVSALKFAGTSGFSALGYSGHHQIGRYNGIWGNRWLLEAAYARALSVVQETPSVDEWRVQDLTVSPSVTTGGIGAYEAGNHSVNHQYVVKMSAGVGRHQVKYGIEHEGASYALLLQRTGPTFVTPAGVRTATGASILVLPDPAFGRMYRVTGANLNAARVTSQAYTNVFAQDTWRVTNRLSAALGIRYEQQALSGTVVTDFQLKQNWAPRLGLSYDVTADHRTVVFGQYGRYLARMPNDLASRVLGLDAGIGADYFDAALTQPIPDGTLAGPPGRQTSLHYVVAGNSAESIDTHAKMSAQDEFAVGAQRDVREHLSVSVRWIHRDLVRVLEDAANVPAVAYFLGVPGVSSVDYVVTNPNRDTPIFSPARFLGAKFDDPVRRYDAIEVTASRRLARAWSMTASYRWSRLRGNFEGFYRDANGQTNPGTSSLYDFPTNDPSYTAIGVTRFGFAGDIRYLGDPAGILPLDRPHAINLYGNWNLTRELNLGLVLHATSGAPLTALAANPVYTNGGEIPLTPLGIGFQTVDGFRTRTPFDLHAAVHADYVVPFEGANRLVLVADVFNFLNLRRATGYDSWSELSFGVRNPDFGKPISQVVAGPRFQAPLGMRLGVRFEF